MALIHIGFFSETLGMCTSCDIVFPQPKHADEAIKPMKTLWLLHGGGENHTTWQRMVPIERYAEKANIAIIMPDAHLSAYTDMAHGLKFATYITEELPGIMRRYLPLSDKREDNFIAGDSMGGYGAIRLGFSRPDQYGRIGIFSHGLKMWNGLSPELFHLIFGTAGADDASLLETVKNAAKGENPPEVFLGCGTEDPLMYADCLEAENILSAFRLETKYVPGAHDWDCFDRLIRLFLKID